MFRIPDSNGTSVVVNEIYEDGFNITASNYNNKSIKTFKRPILESYFTKAKRIVIEDIDEEMVNMYKKSIGAENKENIE